MAKRPIADEGLICPLHKKDVSAVCHKCPWYTQVRGANPQTGADLDEWGCSIAWMPLLMIENAKHVRGTQAATESFRNEWAKSANSPLQLIETLARAAPKQIT